MPLPYGPLPTDPSGMDPDADPWAVSGTLLLSRAARLWEQALEARLRENNLLPAELRVLGALLAQGGDGLTMGQIREFVVVTAGAVTKAVRRLEEDGLVTKRTDESDARVAIVSLTEQGAARARLAFSNVFARFDESFGDASDEQRQTLLDSLRMLVAVLERPSSPRRAD